MKSLDKNKNIKNVKCFDNNNIKYITAILHM